jgi:hypothetical protein
MPSDKLEQVGKGMVGAIVIEPAGTVVTAPAVEPCTTGTGTKLQATCTAADTTTYRDLVAVTQQGVNVLYANVATGTGAGNLGGPDTAVINPETAKPLGAVAFRPVQNFKPEGAAPADSEDSGVRAIAYKTEPEWFRLAAFPPNLPLELQHQIVNTSAVYSNTAPGVCPGTVAAASVPACDPQTPIFTATPGQAARLHFVEPGGGSRRAHTPKVHGHIWQREPHVGKGVGDAGCIDLNGDGKCDPFTSGIGNNPYSQMIGSAEGYGPGYTYELIFDNRTGMGGIGAGGTFAGSLGCTTASPCDFWYGMQDPSARFQGMWGVFRVAP